MKSDFRRVTATTGSAMADPNPPPEPRPFPIKIVNDPPPPPPNDDLDPDVLPPTGRRYDQFYPAWEKFLALEPKRAKRTSRAAQRILAERKVVEESSTDGLKVEENAATSWEQAAAECKKKVDAIVKECMRLNQKYHDMLFDLEASLDCLQSLNGRFPKAVDKIDIPPWIKRVEDIFDDPQFYIDGATATDVHQGSSGDCWFLAALMAVSAKKELIEQLCVARHEEVGVYGFVFYRDGEWVYEVIDDKLFLRVGDDDDLNVVRGWDSDKKEGMSLKYDDDKLKAALQKGGTSLYFSHCKSNETWLPLIEKAYAKAHGDYYAIEGGFASEGIEDLTGGVGVVLNPEDIMNKDRFWKEQLSQVNSKYLFGGGSKSTGSKGFVGGHAYAVLQAWEEGDLRLLKLRNPWGEKEWEGDWSDGSKLWTAEMMTKLNHTFGDDGVFWISYKDFLKHFPSINRVRLFSKEWSVAQQWTCVNVPWTVGYLDTKFQFAVSKQGPVVIVLCQPDDRYFYGLRGRFFFSLHFRVYKEGDDDGRWLVRSMHNSGNETIFTRSVSAEIEDLEPGTYNVVFKITAHRSTTSGTNEEAIYKYAVERKTKLMHVGRRFDYAQSKGNLRAMEEANRKREKQDRRDAQKSGWKKERKIRKRNRERDRKRRDRVMNAMKAKHKAVDEQRRERAKAAHANQEKRSTGTSPGETSESNNEDKMGTATPITETGTEKQIEAETIAGASTGHQSPRRDGEMQPSIASGVLEKTMPSDSAGDTTTAHTEQREPPDEQSAAHAATADSEPNVTITPGVEALKLCDEPGEEKSRGGGDGEEGSISPPHATEGEDLDNDNDDDCRSAASTIDMPEQMNDDDFDWDSAIDGPSDYDSSEDEGETTTAAKNLRAKKDLFEDDPWNAVCVVGVRVYSKAADVKVRVVREEDDDEEEEEEEEEKRRQQQQQQQQEEEKVKDETDERKEGA